MFLSVVIPVFNAEKTIGRCLDSIWSQGLPDDDFEVICVDDCSTDDSFETLKTIAKYHPQLKVLRNSRNLRAGGGRNNGVREASGEYVVFIDADDYFYKKTLLFAYEYQKEHRLDILMLDFSRQHSEEEESKVQLNFRNTDVMNGKTFMSVNTCPFGPCKFVFRRTVMVDNSIWFEENCCCEDVDWCFKLVLATEYIQYLPRILSVVIINNRSQTAVEHKSFKTVTDKLFAAKRLYDNVYQRVRDSNLGDYVFSVCQLYWNEGLKYMSACNASVVDKVKVIKLFIPYEGRHSFAVRVICRYPGAYAIFTNLLSCLVPSLISVKRKYLNR